MTPEQLRAYANTLANEEADVFNDHAAALEENERLKAEIWANPPPSEWE